MKRYNTKSLIKPPHQNGASAMYERPSESLIRKKLNHYGFQSKRFMWWWWPDIINFGDWIGPELYLHRTGTFPIYAPVYRRALNVPVHVTAGSLLTFINVDNTALVWGTGILNTKTKFPRPREIRSVRGPLTRARCEEQGYKCPDIYGDPGILVPDIYPEESASLMFDVGFIPHFGDTHTAHAWFGHRDDVRIIDVRQPVHDVVLELLSCRLLISSSLHGIIVAHAYGRRALHVGFAQPIPGDGVKFEDYYRSVGFDEAPKVVTLSKDTRLGEIKALAEVTPVPDLERLREQLRDVCPF